MIVEKSERSPEIDLTGPDGNAFVLLGYAKTYSKQLSDAGVLFEGAEYDYEQISTEMKSSDYENLVAVFDKYFGKFVTLVR